VSALETFVDLLHTVAPRDHLDWWCVQADDNDGWMLRNCLGQHN
jgi:hypothetical protein